MGTNAEVGMRLAELRDACGYTQETMASELEISLDTYARYEETGEDIPISVIYHAAKVCGVDFTEIIYGAAARLDTYHIVKAGEGKSVDRYPGYAFEDLAFRYKSKIMQPLLVRLDPSDKPAALVSHSGQEFNYVLEGTVVLVFDGKEYVLNQGDSVYFNPMHMHGQRCGGDEPAVFLTMIAE